MPTVTLPNNWTPRFYQLAAFRALQSGFKRAYLVWHRRSGKDDICLHFTATQIVQRVGVYWHMLPEASQARKAIWDAINPHTGKKRIDEAFPLALRKRTIDNEMKIEFINGSLWQVIGSDNYNSLVGTSPIMVVFSEWALANPSSWAYIRPILAENGGIALFITTPRGRNHAARFYEFAKNDSEWFCQKLTAYDTNVFTPAQLESEKREYIEQFGEDEGTAKFNQEYMVSFDAAIQGAYYGSFLARMEQEGRITAVPYDRSKSVTAVLDIGFGDSTAIWFVQQVGKELRWIDCYEASNQGLDHYVKVLNSKDYTYEPDVLPHDADNGQLASGKSIAQQWRELGRKCIVLPRGDVDGGIQQVRSILSVSWFDDVKTAKGVEALRNYQRKWDEERKVFSAKPLHNWASHFADSARYVANYFSRKQENVLAQPTNVVYHRQSKGML